MSAFDDFIAECRRRGPEVFVVLGSGMAGILQFISTRASVPFSQVPGLAECSVEGHRGALSLARWEERIVLISEGRLHYYEGHPWEAIVRPIQIAAGLGIRTAILTNAAGGIRDDLEPGTVMPIRDHLEWNRPYPALWRDPPRRSPYSKRLLDLMKGSQAAKPGVYAALTGPCFETPAEIRAVRSCGADAVGMSTSREAIAGAGAGMEVAAVSLVTNWAAGLTDEPLNHVEVMSAGIRATGRMAELLGSLLSQV